MTKIWILADVPSGEGDTDIIGAYSTREKALARREAIVDGILDREMKEGSNLTEREQEKFRKAIKFTYWITEMELE